MTAVAAPAPPAVAPAPAPTAGWVVIAAHGGAGASTVAALLTSVTGPGVALDATRARRMELIDRPRTVLLVARATGYGLARAADRLADWKLGPAPWLVTVADAPLPDPEPVRYRITALSTRIAGHARLDYLPAARALDDPTQLLSSRAVQRAAEQLLALITGSGTGGRR